MPRMVMKEWRLHCQSCRESVKHLGWLHEAFPRCKCGGVLSEDRPLRKSEHVIPDDIPGGLVMEHVCPGRKVYSRSELNQVLMENGGWRVSDYGWTGPTEQVYSRWTGTPSAMVSTQEERRASMAAHLGLTLEEFERKFCAAP